MYNHWGVDGSPGGWHRNEITAITDTIVHAYQPKIFPPSHLVLKTSASGVSSGVPLQSNVIIGGEDGCSIWKWNGTTWIILYPVEGRALTQLQSPFPDPQNSQTRRNLSDFIIDDYVDRRAAAGGGGAPSIATLVAMGYDAALSARALAVTRGDIQAAAELLMMDPNGAQANRGIYTPVGGASSAAAQPPGAAGGAGGGDGTKGGRRRTRRRRGNKKRRRRRTRRRRKRRRTRHRRRRRRRKTRKRH